MRLPLCITDSLLCRCSNALTICGANTLCLSTAFTRINATQRDTNKHAWNLKPADTWLADATASYQHVTDLIHFPQCGLCSFQKLAKCGFIVHAGHESLRSINADAMTDTLAPPESAQWSVVCVHGNYSFGKPQLKQREAALL